MPKSKMEKWTITKITGFKIKDFRGSNTLWNYVMVDASLRSHITHHDQSGLSRPNHKGIRERKMAIFTI